MRCWVILLVAVVNVGCCCCCLPGNSGKPNPNVPGPTPIAEQPAAQPGPERNDKIKVIWTGQGPVPNKGEVAVDQAIAVAKLVGDEAGLADISVFLKRIARAESNLGEDPNTYRKGYYGGIWQVDQIAFLETKNVKAHPNLTKLHTAVSKVFASLGKPGDWIQHARWEDCTHPVFSATAARLFLATIPEPVPDSLEEQAAYWKKYYNTAAGKGTVEHFIQADQGK